MVWFFAACAPSTSSSPPSEQEPAASTAETGGSTGETAGETGLPTVPLPEWVLYPPAPYDCSLGVPSGEPAVRTIRRVTGTEGIVFDLEGYVVTEERSTGNLTRWTIDGDGALYSPGIGTARGLNLLNNGDVVIASGSVPELWGVTAATGGVYPIANLPVDGAAPGGRAPATVDVAADGSLAVGTLYGKALLVDPTGEVLDLGRVGEWGMGAAFSVDQSRVVFSRWDAGFPELYVSARDGDGWTPIVPWTEVPSYGTLSGLAVDLCDNVYVVDERCHVFRVPPDGEAELLVSAGPFAQECRTLAFGSGLGGWDAYKLYASTYGEIAEIDVGVPGRPR